MLYIRRRHRGDWGRYKNSASTQLCRSSTSGTSSVGICRMMKFLKYRNGDFWVSFARAALLMLAACYALRAFALPPTGVAQDVVKIVQLVVAVVGIGAGFRWAVLQERDQGRRRSK